MLAMRPIDEPDVIDLLNDGRFEGDIEGYIMMDGPTYLGHALFKVENGVTTVLDSSIQDHQQLDGIVRACIAAGDNREAKLFLVNKQQANLAKWWDVFCKEKEGPVETGHLFTFC
ncbi:MAG: hypothetical protein ACK5JF_12905 [Oscillospiraceae bacterium]